MNAVTYFTWMWAVERKGKIVEECKNKIALLCKSKLTVKIDTNLISSKILFKWTEIQVL